MAEIQRQPCECGACVKCPAMVPAGRRICRPCVDDGHRPIEDIDRDQLSYLQAFRDWCTSTKRPNRLIVLTDELMAGIRESYKGVVT